jgi:CheY-like chemotaxis protein
MIRSSLPSASNPARGLRILVFESHQDTREWLERHLQELGHQVRSTGEMNEALSVLTGGDFEVLISEIGRPDVHEGELLLRAGQARPILAIAMSGQGAGAARFRSQAAGFRHYLLKPFPPEALEAMLEEAIRVTR